MPDAPNPSIRRLSGAIGVWKPCAPPQVMLCKACQTRVRTVLGGRILLDHNPGTLGDKIKVCTTMNDNGSVALLDDAWQDTESGRRTGIPFRKYRNRRTLMPGNVGCMNGCFYVCSVIVERESLLVGNCTTASVFQVIRVAKTMTVRILRIAKDIPGNWVLGSTMSGSSRESDHERHTTSNMR
jgi:hypothetical protein